MKIVWNTEQGYNFGTKKFFKQKNNLQDIGCLQLELEWKEKCRLGVHIDTLVIIQIISNEGNQT
jgi:hypothetical protein